MRPPRGLFRLPRHRLRALLAGFVAVAALAAVSAGWWLVHDLPDPGALASHIAGPTAKIYDRHGNLLFEVLPPSDTAGSRTLLKLDQFPLALRQATIATEDAAFYSHPGVDWRGILRAARINLREGRVAAGGSTITQQVARLLLLDDEERQERTLRRKLREIVLALLLERRLTKDEILALYLNHTYYGNLAYGAEAAAQSYFGKRVWELDTAECTLLAGLPQAPALYNPLTDLEAARTRQGDVLRLMVKAGYIGQDEARLAHAERLRFAASAFPVEAPHFVMWVLQQLEARYGPALVDGRGLEVTTTLDLGLQDAADAIVRRQLEELSGRASGTADRNVHNAALVAIDPATGEILAMVGSPDYFDARIDGAVNAAIMPRQPGSALKPFTYATAFDSSRSAVPWSPATVLSDVPTTFTTADGKLYAPENYDRLYHGPMSLREALATSNNLIAVKVLEHVGVAAMVRTARDLGITSLTDPQRYDLTVTLGGGEVTLLELTGAYAALAAAGRYRTPVAILRVEDASGRLLERFEPEPGRQALDPRVAALVTNILSDPEARAPAFGEWSALRLNRPAAAKTGTTSDWRDNWALGYTPDLAVGVWVGNA
ncbi:MAG TPA: transglycosylase domain-containing protein, partial [Ardenticatenaceae bacterium]|nr:transglycosylase domain-containing protein [Ardenticatenaceae bacterium]